MLKYLKIKLMIIFLYNKNISLFLIFVNMESDIINEQYAGHNRSMNLRILNEISKSICKIKRKIYLGTGFFLKIEKKINPLYMLVTAHHVISYRFVEEKITIKINAGFGNIEQEIKLDDKERKIICLKEYDITAIEIIDQDNLKNKVKFLNYEKCKKFEDYINADIFIMHHPRGEDIHCNSGKIVVIKGGGDFLFEHNLETDEGSSGSPILLMRSEEPKVIGVHISAVLKNPNNVGTFINILAKELED